MLRMSKKAEYALMALKDLASRQETGAASAREIAERYEIPLELMAKVLQRLTRQRLLTSHHGTRGGYHLARSASRISVADVIEAIAGPVTVTVCSSLADDCDQHDTCNIREPLWRIRDQIVRALTAYSIQALVSDESPTVSISMGRRSPDQGLPLVQVESGH